MIDLFKAIENKHACILSSTIVALMLVSASPTSAASISITCRTFAYAGQNPQHLLTNTDIPLTLFNIIGNEVGSYEFTIDDMSRKVTRLPEKMPAINLSWTKDTLSFKYIHGVEEIYSIDRVTGVIDVVNLVPGDGSAAPQKVINASIGNCVQSGSHKF